MDKIEQYTKDLDENLFNQNEMIFDAVVRNLEIIGEASKHVPQNIRDSFPEIPWKRMIGLRNLVIHEYFGVDVQTVWQIVSRNIPETKPELIKLLHKIDKIL